MRTELEVLVALAPLMRTNLETPWLQDAFMTDASEKGFGVIVTKTTSQEAREEAASKLIGARSLLAAHA